MEEQKQELEVLKEVIEQIKKTLELMKDCYTVTVTEYQMLGLYLDELEDRATKLEIDINGCKLEEV